MKNVSDGTSPGGQQLSKIILKSMHKLTSYAPDKLNIWAFWPLFDPCDLDFQPTRKMSQMALLLLEDIHNNCAKLFLKSMHKCTSHGPVKLNIWPFWPSFHLCDIDLQPTWKKMFQMAHLLLKCNNCAELFWNPCINVQVMLRTSSIHVFENFEFYLTPETLTFNLPKNVSNSTSPPQGNNCAKLFWNPCIITQVMVRTNLDGHTDARTPN